MRKHVVIVLLLAAVAMALAPMSARADIYVVGDTRLYGPDLIWSEYNTNHLRMAGKSDATGNGFVRVTLQRYVDRDRQVNVTDSGMRTVGRTPIQNWPSTGYTPGRWYRVCGWRWSLSRRLIAQTCSKWYPLGR